MLMVPVRWGAVLLVFVLVDQGRGTQLPPPTTQITTSLSGVVQDRTGAAVPGATITLQQEGREIQTTTSDANGSFRFAQIRLDQFGPNMEVVVSLQGFATVREAVSLRVGQSASISIQLPISTQLPDPPPGPAPTEPVWNLWAQANATSEGIKPEPELPPQEDFFFIVDLSGVALDGIPGAESTSISRTLQRLLEKAADQSTISLQVVIVPDERAFQLREQAARVQTLKIDVAKMRAFRRPSVSEL